MVDEHTLSKPRLPMLYARNTPSPTLSDFIMHISCMAWMPCKPLCCGVSVVLKAKGFMQNHALYACTRSLRQASQKKGCFRESGRKQKNRILVKDAGWLISESDYCCHNGLTFGVPVGAVPE